MAGVQEALERMRKEIHPDFQIAPGGNGNTITLHIYAVVEGDVHLDQLLREVGEVYRTGMDSVTDLIGTSWRERGKFVRYTVVTEYRDKVELFSAQTDERREVSIEDLRRDYTRKGKD